MKTLLDLAGLFRPGLIAALVAAGAGAGAQQSDKDVQALKAIAGTYAIDCTKADRMRLLVSVKSLSVVAGEKRVDAVRPLYAYSYWGKSPPPNARGALIGEPARRGRPGVTLIEWTDKRGAYLTVDADKPLEAMFGKSALAGKFRRCPKV